MIVQGFIDSSDVGSGERETRLRFWACVWPWQWDEPLVEGPDGRMIEWRDLSERDRLAIEELLEAKLNEKYERELAYSRKVRTWLKGESA